MNQLPPITLNAAEERWLARWKEGPRRTRWSDLPVQAGDRAPDLVLDDSNGVSHRLSDHWREAPIVLVLLRHFGCSCTAGRLERLAAELPLLQEAGARVLCVCQAEPERARRFKSERQLAALLLCDPRREAYAAYGLLEGHPAQVVYGMSDAFLRRDIEAGAELQRSRLGTPRSAVDNPWQLPGDFVIDRGGGLRLAHRPSYCDGEVACDVLLAALRESRLEVGEQGNLHT